jgi:SNF2 family DNA or RNA helicase
MFYLKIIKNENVLTYLSLALVSHANDFEWLDIAPVCRDGNDRKKLLGKLSGVDVLLTTYHTLMNDFAKVPAKSAAKRFKRETIFTQKFHRIVVDEAHTIRNSKARKKPATLTRQSSRWRI